MKKHNLSLLLRSSHLLHSTHFKFGVIAAALCAVSLFVGLSAYLVTSTEKEPLAPTFTTSLGEDLGLSIAGSETLPSEVTPGQSIDLYPTVSATGSIPIYVFVEVDYGGLEIPVSSGEDETVREAISSDWYPLGGWKSEASYTSGGKQIYYLGNGSGLSVLGDDSTVFESVIVPIEDKGGNTYTPSIIAYGIQAAGVDETDPAGAWDLIKGNLPTQTGGTQP